MMEELMQSRFGDRRPRSGPRSLHPDRAVRNRWKVSWEGKELAFPDMKA
jgi:hypothetical protein